VKMSAINMVINSFYTGLQFSEGVGIRFGTLWQQRPSFVQDVSIAISAALESLRAFNFIQPHKYVTLSFLLDSTNTFDLVDAIVTVSKFSLSFFTIQSNEDAKNEDAKTKKPQEQETALLKKIADYADLTCKIGVILNYADQWKAVDLSAMVRKFDGVPVLEHLNKLSLGKVITGAVTVYCLVSSLNTIIKIAPLEPKNPDHNSLIYNLMGMSIYQITGAAFYGYITLLGSPHSLTTCAYRTYKVIYQLITNEPKGI